MNVRRRPARGAIAAAAACGALALGVSCSGLPDDPNAPVAIEISEPVLPSVVKGDTLRDSTGAPAPLRARVLNSSNEVIADAPVTFIVVGASGVVGLDAQTGLVVGADTGQTAVIASAGTIQSVPVTLRVVPRPDTLEALGPTSDTLTYLLGSANSLPLRVRVGHDTTPGVTPRDSLVPVPSYLVRFAIVDPAGLPTADSTRVLLVNDQSRPSLADTTGADGVASRSVFVGPRIAPPVPPSVTVEATARLPDGSPVPGSPVRFTVVIEAQ